MKGQKSLLLRLVLIVCVLILLPAVLMFIVFFRTIPDRMEQQAEINAGFYIGQVADSVSGAMDLARDMTYSAVMDDSLRRRMQDTETELGTGAQNDLVRVASGTAAWNQQVLRSVYLFRRDGDFTFYAPTGSYMQQQRRMQQVCRESEGLSSVRTMFLVGQAPENTAYFLVDYKNMDNLELLGKLIVEMNVEAMVSAGDLIRLYPGTSVELLDENGTCLYRQGEVLEHLAETTADASGDSGAVWEKHYYHVSRKISDYDLQLEVFIPKDAIYSLVWESRNIFTVLCAAILLLAILAALFTGRALRRPLRRMEDALSRMAESDYTARMPSSGYRELARFEDTFNNMADHLDSSFRDAYQKGIQLQESESRLLAAQINPHFVFNVLETINMRCVDAGLKDISRMVTDLAQLLRGNIGVGSGSQKITFEQELNYVRYYLDLQRQRFGENLTCSIDYEDEEILQYLVPRLTVQPLVENAIVHGLEPRRGLGKVSVLLWEEDQTVCVRIQDNGVGFDPAQLDLSAEADRSGRHNHIALPNILRRLDLLYGDRASLDIRSQPGGGTTVLLVLPIDQREV